MPTQIELKTFRSNVYSDAGLSRILGIIEAYVQGKKVTLNWVSGQILKGHDVSDAQKILESFEDHLVSINSQRYLEVKEKLS